MNVLAATIFTALIAASFKPVTMPEMFAAQGAEAPGDIASALDAAPERRDPTGAEQVVPPPGPGMP